MTLLKSIMDRNRAIDRSLPFPRLLFGLRQLRDVGAGVVEGDEVATARQRYWIFQPWFPSAISHWRAAITPSPSPAGYRRPFGRTPDRRTAAPNQTAEHGPAIDLR